MGNKKHRTVSPAEMEILRLVWQLQEATVQQICQKLPVKRKIAYKTVLTLLTRLEGKGYVTHEKCGQAYVFSPAVKREEVIKRSVLDFMDKLFGGDPKPLLQFLIEDGHIDTEDIERMKDLLNDA